MQSHEITAIRWNHGYDATIDDGRYIRLSKRGVESLPRTLGGERIANTAKRYPNVWIVVHPSYPAFVTI